MIWLAPFSYGLIMPRFALSLLVLLGMGCCFASGETDEGILRTAKELKTRQLEIATEASRAFPKNFSALQLLANAYRNQGDHQRLIAILKRCEELYPRRADVSDQLGQQYVLLDDYENAKLHFHRALKIDGRLTSVRLHLAEVFLLTGESEELLSLLANVSDKTGQADYLRGEARFQNADFKLAKEEYERAVGKQPKHVHAIYGLIKVATQAADSNSVAELTPRFEELQGLIAEQNQRRRDDYDDIWQLRRNLATTCADAGVIYAKQKQSSEARRLWQDAIRHDSKQARGYRLLAKLYLNANQNLPLAQNLANKGLELEPNAESYFVAGWAAARNERFVEAGKHLREAVRLDPKNQTYSKVYIAVQKRLGK